MGGQKSLKIVDSAFDLKYNRKWFRKIKFDGFLDLKSFFVIFVYVLRKR